MKVGLESQFAEICSAERAGDRMFGPFPEASRVEVVQGIAFKHNNTFVLFIGHQTNLAFRISFEVFF